MTASSSLMNAVTTVSDLLRKGMPALGVAIPFEPKNENDSLLLEAETYNHFLKVIESDFERMDLTLEERTRFVEALKVINTEYFKMLAAEIHFAAKLKLLQVMTQISQARKEDSK